MRKGMKILGILFLVFAVFFTISIRDAEATVCYKLSYSWNWSDWDYGYMYLYSDGTFEYADDYDNYGTGSWYKWGTTYAFDYNEGCYLFASGPLAKGFMKCADGGDIGYAPGIYTMKKTNCKYIPLANSKNAKTKGSDKKGPSLNDPH